MDVSRLSAAFQAVYGNPAVFASFSEFIPISFARVLPFRADDVVMDQHELLVAEERLLAEASVETRLRVVELWARCGLLPEADAANLKPVIDFFDADFFELMGEVYANARMFRCALRWHRELIRYLECVPNAGFRTDYESVYASVGYCLYALGLFEEAIAWSKACIGPRQVADTASRALIAYEAAPGGCALRAIERVGPRVRYLVSGFDAAFTSQCTPRLKTAMATVAPFQEVYMDWMTTEWKVPEPGGVSVSTGVRLDNAGAAPDEFDFCDVRAGGCVDGEGIFRRGEAVIARGVGDGAGGGVCAGEDLIFEVRLNGQNIER